MQSLGLFRRSHGSRLYEFTGNDIGEDLLVELSRLDLTELHRDDLQRIPAENDARQTRILQSYVVYPTIIVLKTEKCELNSGSVQVSAF